MRGQVTELQTRMSEMVIERQARAGGLTHDEIVDRLPQRRDRPHVRRMRWDLLHGVRARKSHLSAPPAPTAMILTTCDRCRRGVIHWPDGWGAPCNACNGQGTITLSHLAKQLDEWPETLRTLFVPKRHDSRMRASTCFRILTKILHNFPEAP
jgi:hypothetical protein